MFTQRTLPPLTADEIAESELVTLGCDSCRAGAGLLPLDPERIADDTEYYCPTCHTQWLVTDSWRDRIPPLGDLLFATMWLTFITGVLLGIFYLIAADSVARYGEHYIDQGDFMATLGVGFLCWGAVVVIFTNLLWQVENAIRLAVCWVWGEPLWYCEERNS